MEINIAQLLSERYPHLAKILPAFALHSLQRLLHEHEINEILAHYGGLSPAAFLQSTLHHLDIDYSVDFSPRITRDGRYIFVSNHPFGGIDGMILADMLIRHGVKATVYHAGLSTSARDKAQEDFINDRVQVVCATIAFGMGIDKSNVRWVIHYNLPKSIESFYQEIGRAGRDGVKSDTLLFYSLGDLVMLSKFAMDSGQQTINLEKLNRMQQYAESDICRRRILLNYFGETMDHDCGNCDVCRNPPERFDGTIIVQKALSAIMRADQQIGTRMLIAILRGNYFEELVEKGYDKLKTFGAGRDIPQKDWQDYLLQMLNMGYFEVAYNENNHLKVTSAGAKVLYGQEKAMLVVIKREEPKTKGRKKETEKQTKLQIHPAVLVGEEDQALFEELRILRKRLADQQAIPAYIVLSDKTLHLLALQRPTTLEEFGMVSGIGEYKKERYGKEFVETIKNFLGNAN